MQGHIASANGTTAEAVVLDLSYDGCGIETPMVLSAGQTITLSVTRRGAILADVRWCEGGRAGLVFRNDAAAGGRQPRSDERVSLKFEANMRRIGMGNYRVEVWDLSPQGCKVGLVERPRVGEHVLLKFDVINSIDAEVCWVHDYAAGLRFERPIHAAVFDLMMRRLRGGR